jgi:hypothetical protein
MSAYKEILFRYIPEPSVNEILTWLETSNVQLNITKTRNSKLGDYRPPQKVKYHKISVNHDLNKYQFLLTLVHEFAHLKAWEQYGNKIKPHGIEWKNTFRSMMSSFLNSTVFPEDLLQVVKKYLRNPSSSTSNSELLTVMRRYDDHQDFLTLEDLPTDAIFQIDNGFVFKKVEKLRKRYKCIRMDNKRMYLVSPMVKVVPWKNQ